MTWVLAALVALFLAALVTASVRGRVRLRSCCAADPSRDLRMRAAFEDDSHRPVAD